MTDRPGPSSPDGDVFSQILQLLHAAHAVIPVGAYAAARDPQALRTACLAAAAYGAMASEAARAENELLATGADVDELTASRAGILPAMAGSTPTDLPVTWYWQASQLAGHLRQARNTADGDRQLINAASDTARALMLLLHAYIQPAAAAPLLAEASEMLARAQMPGQRPDTT